MAGSDESNPVRIGPPKYLKEVHWPDNYIAVEFQIDDLAVSPYPPNEFDCSGATGAAPDGYIWPSFEDVYARWDFPSPSKQSDLPDGVWRVMRYQFVEAFQEKQWVSVAGGSVIFSGLPDFTGIPPQNDPSPTNPVVWTNTITFPTTYYSLNLVEPTRQFGWHTLGDGSGVVNPPPVPKIGRSELLTLNWDTSPLGVQFRVALGTLVDGPNCYIKATPTGGALHGLYVDGGEEYKPSTMVNVSFVHNNKTYTSIAATRAGDYNLWMLFKPDLTG